MTTHRGADSSRVEWRGRIGLTDEVTLTEAAELLDLQPRHVRHLVEIGEIPARTNRLLTHISLADVEIYRLRTRLTVSPGPHPVIGAAHQQQIADDAASVATARSAAAGA